MMESNEYNMINTAEMSVIRSSLIASPPVVHAWGNGTKPCSSCDVVIHPQGIFDLYDDPDFRKLYNDREQGFTNYIRHTEWEATERIRYQAGW